MHKKVSYIEEKFKSSDEESDEELYLENSEEISNQNNNMIGNSKLKIIFKSFNRQSRDMIKGKIMRIMK
jgi:hypothetical protein